MLRCWNADPAQRPGFSELSTTVANIIATMKAATDADRRRTPAYVNDVNTDYLRPVDHADRHSPPPPSAASVNSDDGDTGHVTDARDTGQEPS